MELLGESGGSRDTRPGTHFAAGRVASGRIALRSGRAAPRAARWSCAAASLSASHGESGCRERCADEQSFPILLHRRTTTSASSIPHDSGGAEQAHHVGLISGGHVAKQVCHGDLD